MKSSGNRNGTAENIHKPQARKKRVGLTAFEMALFAMFGAMMFASKVAMEFLPNVHLLGMFIMVFTLVFRVKALIPIYIYVFLNGILAGFAAWWVPYLYIWAVLWAVTMLLPGKMPDKAKMVVYPLVCALFGLSFGTLYAPAQAVMFGLSFKQTVAWIVAGLPYDAIHAVSNLIVGILVFPLSKLLSKLCTNVSKKICG
ncbi:MAG: hypothetical protein ACI4GZ_06630 [Ruminococcus sp.]